MAAPVVLGIKPGDLQPSIFPGTQAGLQLALNWAGSSVGNEVYIGPGTITGITNLTMYAKTTLRGSGTLSTLLVRDPAATGITLREKSAAEGNDNGATGINVLQLGIYANGSSGDGINFGNQGGPSFNALASLIDVLVRDYTTGTGIKLNSNAIHCRNTWANANQVGYLLEGGSSHYSGIWAEGNTDTGIRINSPWNTLTGIHLEDVGVGPNSLMEIAVSSNNILGCSMQIGANGISKLIREMSGVRSIQYVGVNVIAAGHTWTSTLYSETFGQTISADDRIPWAFDYGGGHTGHFRDSDNGLFLPVTSAAGFQLRATGSMATGTTITPDEYSMLFGMTGTGNVDNITNKSRWTGREIIVRNAANMTYKHLSGGTGNIRCAGAADLTMTNDQYTHFISDGTLWWQSTPRLTALDFNTYAPTRSAEVNMDANVTFSTCKFMRMGNECTVSGRFTANPTAAAAASFEMTLPVASNLGAAEDVSGTAFCGAVAGLGAEIIGVAANDTAKVQWVAVDVASQTWSFTFTYRII